MRQRFEHWMESLGAPVGLVEGLIVPIAAALLIWLVRELALILVRRHVNNPKRRRAIQQGSIYLALVLAWVIFQTVWTRSIGRISPLIAEPTGWDQSAIGEFLRALVLILFGGAATVLAIALVRVLLKALRVRVRAWGRQAPSLRIQRLTILTPQTIRQAIDRLLHFLFLAFVAIALLYYMVYVLSVYPATAEWGARALDYVWSVIASLATAVIDYLPKLVYLLVIGLFARYLIRALRFLLEAVERRDVRLPGFDPDWADPTYKLARVVVVLFAMVIGYPYLPGAQSEVFQGFSVFIGALITFGSSTVIGNMISGVVLTYTGSFRMGDRINVGGTIGDVVEKTLFVTRLRTIDNEVVSIPNGIVMTGSVINYSQKSSDKKLVLKVRAGIGYDVDWRKVHELMLAAAQHTRHVSSRPPPTVWQISLDDFAVTYELRATTERPDLMGFVKSELVKNVLDEFNKAGIEIMTPSVRSHRDGTATAIPAQYNPPVGTVARLKVDLETVGEAAKRGMGAKRESEE
ncbi:MAG: mechanosensitive ion channel [Bryobacterales bacterium]